MASKKKDDLRFLTPNNFNEFMSEHATGMFENKEKEAIRNGFELTERLRKYTETSFGLREDVLSTKRHTIIWSPPGAGKTFTANRVIEDNNLAVLKIHGASTIYDAMVKLVTTAYRNRGKQIFVWKDDCDSFFERGSGVDNLNITKGILDDEREPDDTGRGGILQYNVDVTGAINKAEAAAEYDPNKAITAEALKYYRDSDGLGISLPMNNFTFFWTTNKNLATKNEAFGPKGTQNKRDEHAVRDRVNWRKFDIDDLESWGWMASNILSSDCFAKKPGMQGQTLNVKELFLLLNTFLKYWPNLEANSMRTVLEAGAMLKMDPDNFVEEFKQNYV